MQLLNQVNGSDLMIRSLNNMYEIRSLNFIPVNMLKKYKTT